MGKIRDFFKVKHHTFHRPTTIWYKLYIFIIIIAILSLAFLWPVQISALWFELWMLILKFLQTPLYFQLWWFAILVFIIAWLGWLFMPVLEVPGAGYRVLYTRSWVEGDIHVFKTLRGYYIAISQDILAKRIFRYVAFTPVSCVFEGDTLMCQTKDMEISRALMWKRVAEMAIDENKRLRAELSRREKSLTLDEIAKIEKARHGGEKE